MQALTQENRAAVVLAEAEVLKALADAFRAGQMRKTAEKRIGRLRSSRSGGAARIAGGNRLGGSQPACARRKVFKENGSAAFDEVMSAWFRSKF